MPGADGLGWPLLATAMAAPLPAIAQVVVIANGSPITAYDIEQRSKLIALTTHKTPPRQEVVNALIDDRIKIAKAKTYGFEVPEAEINQTFANMARAQHLSAQQFDQMLERGGVAPNTLKARLRAETDLDPIGARKIQCVAGSQRGRGQQGAA